MFSIDMRSVAGSQHGELRVPAVGDEHVPGRVRDHQRRLRRPSRRPAASRRTPRTPARRRARPRPGPRGRAGAMSRMPSAAGSPTWTGRAVDRREARGDLDALIDRPAGIGPHRDDRRSRGTRRRDRRQRRDVHRHIARLLDVPNRDPGVDERRLEREAAPDAGTTRGRPARAPTRSSGSSDELAVALDAVARHVGAQVGARRHATARPARLDHVEDRARTSGCAARTAGSRRPARAAGRRGWPARSRAPARRSGAPDRRGGTGHVVRSAS